MNHEIHVIIRTADTKAVIDCMAIWRRFGEGEITLPILASFLEVYKSGRLRQIQEQDLTEPVNGA